MHLANGAARVMFMVSLNSRAHVHLNVFFFQTDIRLEKNCYIRRGIMRSIKEHYLILNFSSTPFKCPQKGAL